MQSHQQPIPAVSDPQEPDQIEQQGPERQLPESTEPEVFETQESSSEPQVPEPIESQTCDLQAIELTEPQVLELKEPQSEAQPIEADANEQLSEAQTDIVEAVAQAPPQKPLPEMSQPTPTPQIPELATVEPTVTAEQVQAWLMMAQALSKPDDYLSRVEQVTEAYHSGIPLPAQAESCPEAGSHAISPHVEPSEGVVSVIEGPRSATELP